jgi:hypothetical protein
MYIAPRMTITRRMKGIQAKRGSPSNQRLLHPVEEEQLISWIRPWFELFLNTVRKYGILEEDIFNFDGTGFAIGLGSSRQSKAVASGLSDACSRLKARFGTLC